jgi:hypothetical protein
MSIISCTSPAALAGDLAGLQRDKRGQIGLVGAQHLAEAPHQLAALGRGHHAPGQEGGMRLADGGLHVGRAALDDAAGDGAIDRRARRQRALGVEGLRDAHAGEEFVGLGGNRAHGDLL